MKAIFRLLVIGLLTLLGNFFVQNPVFAIETYQVGQVVFSDDFNDGNYNGWQDETGTGGWSVNNGNLLAFKTSKLTAGRLNLSNNAWDNYVLEVDIDNVGGIDEGVGFRHVDPNNSYELNLRHGTGYFNTPEVILRKTENGTTSILKSTHAVSLVNEKWYHVKVEIVNEHIQIWLDNNLIFELDDTGTNLKKGSIALSYWTGDYGSSITRFDNVKVTTLSKQFYPVIFIPGIGGSEFKANQDIIWSQSDGHGGEYSHAYSGGEKIWVNQDEAIKLGDDDYFDVLKLKSDGVTSEADVVPTGKLTPFGYPDIDNFFQSLGYIKGVNYFTFAYDWRKDIASTKDSLDAAISTALQKSGQPKVNIIAHSMGGLVARNYIIDEGKAAKVNKLVELGVPHLGSVKALKASVYGTSITKKLLWLIEVGIPAAEVKDLFSNFASAFELIPTAGYYDFYNGSSSTLPVPFSDERDIDNNKIIGNLNFSQTKMLLSNLGLNPTLLNLADTLHNSISKLFNNQTFLKTYEVIGSGTPTLGQIHETWYITWPIKLIPKYEEIFINGDETVPLYSASLKSDSKDLSNGAKIYYVEQNHTDLVTSNGPAMQLVKSILAEGDSIPVEVKSEKISLEGQQISVDQDTNFELSDDKGNKTGLNQNSEIITQIPNTFYDTLGSSKHAFIKNSASPVKVKLSSSSKTSDKFNLKIRKYSQDSITKTTLYKDLPTNITNAVEFSFNPTDDKAPIININGRDFPPTSEISGNNALDLTPPTTKVDITGSKDDNGSYTGTVTIVLTSVDNGSGVLDTQYSLDNGQSVNTYKDPITLSSSGSYDLQVVSSDKLGNQETPQTIKITIAGPTSTPTPTITASPTPTQSGQAQTQTTSADSSSTQGTTTISVVPSPANSIARLPANHVRVLGVSTSKISDADIPKHEPVNPTILTQKVQPALKFSDLLIIMVFPALVLGAIPLGFGLLSSTPSILKPFPKEMD